MCEIRWVNWVRLGLPDCFRVVRNMGLDGTASHASVVPSANAFNPPDVFWLGHCALLRPASPHVQHLRSLLDTCGSGHIISGGRFHRN